ncbi:hypothetical protein AAFF_G00135660 [Aldrovandia affinis]|uniref:Uncharacterized protein n=1 Tax=Aldrovandia affinis TaxID=143900 RepID=A0AAD7RQ65_9TELE|nr:hypothetical protein AAFF_G00135660 [Aldrovandia affinis]
MIDSAAEILALLAVAALMAQNADGRLLTKCGLRRTLQSASLSVEKGAPTAEELLAKIVCKVELTSGLNTSLVTDPGPVKFDMSAAAAKKTFARNHQAHLRCRGKGIDIGQLHGAFQLSNHVACSDGSSPSLNICQTNCSKMASLP